MRAAKVYELAGVTATATAHARAAGLKPNVVHTRLLRGWTIAEAISGLRKLPPRDPPPRKLAPPSDDPGQVAFRQWAGTVLR